MADTDGSVTGRGSEILPESAPFGLVPAPEDKRLRETVAALAEVGGKSVETILLYGSHVQASSPNQWSAYDFLLVTDSYSKFYRRLTEQGYHRKPAWLLSALSHILAPNIISFDMGRPDQPPAKCAVVSPYHLRRSLQPNSPDHFLKGRVVQKLALVWSRGPAEVDRLLSAIRIAREGIVRWVRPFLPEPFTIDEFAEKMLRVSYRGEIRPEAPDRVYEVFLAQKETLEGIARESLEAARVRGKVLEDSGTYRWKRKPRGGSWVFTTLYFVTSKIRATARWFKYMITFDGWLEYIQRKIERRAGFEVEVEEHEKRWPLIFLWPKLFRVFRTIKEPETAPKAEPEAEAESKKEEDSA